MHRPSPTFTRSSPIARGALSAMVPSLVAALLLSGCTVGGSKGVGVENTRLRSELSDAKKQIASLTAEREELTSKLSEANNARQAALAPDVLAAFPRVAGLRIGSLSGLSPSDKSAPAARVDVYIEPFDGRDRFVQIVGSVSAEADLLGPGADGKATPRVLASVTLTPTQVRDAYRSGLTGTHYSIELPLSPPLADRKGSLVLRVRFADALSGREFIAEKIIELGK